MKYLILLPLIVLLFGAFSQGIPSIEPREEGIAYQIIRKRERPLDDWMAWAFGEEKYAAYRVMKCESGGRADAVNYNTNHTHDRGLFQINDVHAAKVGWNLDSLFDWKVNIKVAKQIFMESNGFGPWVCAGKVL